MTSSCFCFSRLVVFFSLCRKYNKEVLKLDVNKLILSVWCSRSLLLAVLIGSTLFEIWTFFKHEEIHRSCSIRSQLRYEHVPTVASSDYLHIQGCMWQQQPDQMVLKEQWVCFGLHECLLVLVRDNEMCRPSFFSAPSRESVKEKCLQTRADAQLWRSAVSSLLIFTVISVQDISDSLLPGPLWAAVPGDVRVHRLWSKQHRTTQRTSRVDLMEAQITNAVRVSVNWSNVLCNI